MLNVWGLDKYDTLRNSLYIVDINLKDKKKFLGVWLLLIKIRFISFYSLVKSAFIFVSSEKRT